MKNVLLFFLVLMTGTSFAQVNTMTVPDHLRSPQPAVIQNKQFKGDETQMGPIQLSEHWQDYLNTAQTRAEGTESWIGTTYYDLQTNASAATRIYTNPDCDIKISWTGHPNTSDVAFPNRGTFLSESEDCNTFTSPEARIEQGYRTGWGNIMALDDGSNVVVAHTTDDVESRIIISKEQTTGAYQESVLPTNVPQGVLWPHAAAAGNTIHIIAISDPDSTSSGLYEGLYFPLLYWRSTDGGDTWDIQDYIIPGLTAEEFGGSGPDQYSIDADENGNVVILSTRRDNDVILLKSTDNGDIGSWTHQFVYDFPLDSIGYTIGQPYTLDDIGGVNPRGPATFFEEPGLTDSMAFAIPESSGSVVLDENGMAHVAYTEYFISALEENGNPVFWPLVSNIIYWNETFPADSLNWVNTSRSGLDVDQSGVLDYQQSDADGFGRFAGDVVIGEPSIAIVDDKVVIAYRQVMENYYKETSEQHYSHIMMTGSIDNGETWKFPYDVNNMDLAFFPPLVETSNYCFPNIAHISENNVAVMYQFDPEPGFNLNLTNDISEDPIGENTIAEVSFDVCGTVFAPEECSVSTEQIATPETFALQLSPNPATNFTTIAYELTDRTTVQIELTDISGKKLVIKNQGHQPAGQYNLDFNTAELGTGVYLISIRTDNQLATSRLVIAR